MRKFYLCFFLLTAFILPFQGCGGIPKDALSMNEATLEDRQIQTRVFDTSDENKIMSASASLLQDLGFNLDESETDLGLIVVSKDRTAVEFGQVLLMAALSAFSGTSAVYDYEQKIRASVVTSPVGETEDRIAVRVTFQSGTTMDKYQDAKSLMILKCVRNFLRNFLKLYFWRHMGYE